MNRRPALSAVLATVLCGGVARAQVAGPKSSPPAIVERQTPSSDAARVRTLTLDAEKSGVALERYDGAREQAGWTEVCRAPCSTRAWVGWQYRVGGNRVVSSAPFVVEAGRETFKVRAKAVSNGDQKLRMAFVGAGAVMTATGLVLLSAGLVRGADCPDCSRDGWTPGFVVGIVGLAVLGFGLALPSRTRLDMNPQPRSLAQIRLGNGLALSGNRLLF